jgi:hypothetical protein
MSNLLTPAEEAEIKQGFRDTMDTFSDTDITLRIARGVSMAEWSETADARNYQDYTVKAQVVFGTAAAKSDTNMAGVFDSADVSCYIHIDYLVAVGLITNTQPLINPATDVFFINGIEYQMRVGSQQGALIFPIIDNNQVNCVIKGNRAEKYAT